MCRYLENLIPTLLTLSICFCLSVTEAIQTSNKNTDVIFLALTVIYNLIYKQDYLKFNKTISYLVIFSDFSDLDKRKGTPWTGRQSITGPHSLLGTV